MVEEAKGEKEVPEFSSAEDHSGEKAAADQVPTPFTATEQPEAVGVPEMASVDVSPPADETPIAAPSEVVDPSIKDGSVAEEASVQEPASSEPLASAKKTHVPVDMSEDSPVEIAEENASKATPIVAEENVEKTASEPNAGDKKEVPTELDEDGVD